MAVPCPRSTSARSARSSAIWGTLEPFLLLPQALPETGQRHAEPPPRACQSEEGLACPCLPIPQRLFVSVVNARISSADLSSRSPNLARGQLSGLGNFDFWPKKTYPSLCGMTMVSQTNKKKKRFEYQNRSIVITLITRTHYDDLAHSTVCHNHPYVVVHVKL